jgi:hypothetical protein
VLFYFKLLIGEDRGGKGRKGEERRGETEGGWGEGRNEKRVSRTKQ